MNDRDPFADPSDPIDRTLSRAFGSRHVPPMSQPSMLDVRHRARRRQQRRTAGLVGAITLIGAGGVGAYAVRHDDGRVRLSPGDAEGIGAPSTTVACFAVASTVPPLPALSTVVEVEPTVPPTTIPTEGSIDFMPLVSTTTTIGAAGTDPCAPRGWRWHCTGPAGNDEFGRQVFESCEQAEDGQFTTLLPSTVPGQLIGTTTTYPPQFASSTIAIPPDTTTVVSVNGNTGEPAATSTTNVVNESTTTSLG